MKILIRCSSDPKMGLGHFMRCIRLHDQLKKNGKFVKLYIDKRSEFMKKFNFEYDEIYPTKNKFINQNLDANLFINKVFSEFKKEKKIVLKDDYRLLFNWEKKVSKKLNAKMIIFDDFDNSNHFADIIINSKTRYFDQNNTTISNTNKKKTILLLGPKYSIINKIEKNKKFKKFTVVINFGGTKNTLLVNNILSMIIKNNKFINFKVVISPFLSKNNIIKKFHSKLKNIQLIKNSLNLQKLYSKSHLFIGASGTSIYETTAQKLPGIFFEISKNQKTSYKSLEKMGQYFFLDKKYLKKKNWHKIYKLILLIKKNYKNIKMLINNSIIKVDDKGVKRISNNIFKFKKKENNSNDKQFLHDDYKISKCKFEDINDYLIARNRKENIRQSFKGKAINHIDHYLWWFKNRVSSYKLLKGNKIMIFFYHYCINLEEKKYFISGWFNSSDDCTIQDIIFALNWQRKINIKNSKIYAWISFVKKNNILAQKYSARLGWKKISDNDQLYIKLKNKFNMPKSFIYIRK